MVLTLRIHSEWFRTRLSLFIFGLSLCSSFASSGRTSSAVKRQLPDFSNAIVINNQSVPTQVSNVNGNALLLPALNLTSDIRQKKSTGLSLGTLFHLVPPEMRYEYLGRILPQVVNFIRPSLINRTPFDPRIRRTQSIQQPGGIAFPSLEGALLSLAFLTFAVFLVDLVQQVIGRLRTGAAVPLAGGRRRKKRSIGILDRYGLTNDKFGEVFSTMSSNIITAIENPLYPDMNKGYE